MKIFGLFILCFLLTSQASADDLDSKLNKQFELFRKTQKLFIQQVGVERTSFSRIDWENLLSDNSSLAFTPNEILNLQKRQSERAESQRLINVGNSRINLANVRSENRAIEFCAAFPKGGLLHIHPWGTVDHETLGQILELVDPMISANQLKNKFNSISFLFPTELDFLMNDIGETRYSDLNEEKKKGYKDLFFLPLGKEITDRGGTKDELFARFLAVFTLISDQLLGKSPDPTEVMWRAFFSRAVQDQVQYLEITMNPPWWIKNWQKTWPQELADTAQMAEKDYGLKVRFLAGFNRINSVEKNSGYVQEILDLAPSEYLVGVNLQSDEGENPALEKGQEIYGPVMSTAQDRLHRTMHAGELGDVRNSRDAFIMGAERIGHGVLMLQDPVTIEWATQARPGIEINLSSNLVLNVVDSIVRHPFLHFQRLGFKTSLSTDDEGIFRTDINNECQLAISQSDINYTELRELSLNSILTSFASPSLKADLEIELNQRLSAFEKDYCNLHAADCQP